jgi:hypothetical protein
MQRRSLRECVAEAKVIVVATPLDSAPAKPKKEGDGPEVAIRFQVTRILKGELADKMITIQIPLANGVSIDKIVGKEKRWILFLDADYLAGKHQCAGLYGIKLEPEVRAILSSGNKGPLPATQAATKPSGGPAALEKMLHGSWEDDNPCPGGQLILNANGTYERLHYGPGGYHLTGIWQVRWDALPPTLVLTCKTCDARDDIDKATQQYNEQLKLLQLDDKLLVYQFANGAGQIKCERAKDSKATPPPPATQAEMSVTQTRLMPDGLRPLGGRRAEHETATKPRDGPVALEKKLHGSWRDDNPCPGGQLILHANGTYERLHYGPVGYHLTGIWQVRWDALPPTLVLTCKTCDARDDIGKATQQYNEQLKLLQLDDKLLVYQLADDLQQFKCECAKDSKVTPPPPSASRPDAP